MSPCLSPFGSPLVDLGSPLPEPWVWRGGPGYGENVSAIDGVGDRAWAVAGPSILSLEGGVWRTERLADGALTDISVHSENDIWATGSATVRRYRGGWQKVNPPSLPFTGYKGGVKVAHATADDVWLISNGGVKRHQQWCWTVSNEPLEANDIWMASPDEGWLVGNQVIYRWDGDAWGVAEAPIETEWVAIDGRASDEVWIVSNEGAVYQWDGVRWTEDPRGEVSEHVFDLSVPPMGPPWVAGSSLSATDSCGPNRHHYIRPLDRPGHYITANGIWASGEKTFAVGDVGMLEIEADDAVFTDFATPIVDLKAGAEGGVLVGHQVSGTSCINSPAIEGARIYRYDTSGIEKLRAIGSRLIDLWPAAPGTAHIVTEANGFFAASFAGGVIPAIGGSFESVVTSADGRAWAAGDGPVAQWDGTSWSLDSSVDGHRLWTSGNDVWLAGRRGDCDDCALFHFENGVWVEDEAISAENASFWGSTPLNTRVASESGVFLWTGSSWTLETNLIDAKLIAGRASDDIWAYSRRNDDRRLYHFDGVIWQETDLVPPFLVTNIAVDVSGVVWIVGQGRIASVDPSQLTRSNWRRIQGNSNTL